MLYLNCSVTVDHVSWDVDGNATDAKVLHYEIGKVFFHIVRDQGNLAAKFLNVFYFSRVAAAAAPLNQNKDTWSNNRGLEIRSGKRLAAVRIFCRHNNLTQLSSSICYMAEITKTRRYNSIVTYNLGKGKWRHNLESRLNDLQ